MNKKFVLCVEYGTGKVALVVSTPDLTEALTEFIAKCKKNIPETKDIGLPNIIKAEILPLFYESNLKEEVKD